MGLTRNKINNTLRLYYVRVFFYFLTAWCQTQTLANKANIGPPTEYDLSLSSQVKKYAMCNYSKDQFGKVTFNISIESVSGYLTNGMLIATLPEGFRPKERLVICASMDGSGNRYDGVFSVAISGAISLSVQTTSHVAVGAYGGGSFYAV